MTYKEFRDDDRGYLNWVSANDQGFVINIQRSLSTSDARLHHAWCHTITGEPARGRTWTGPYIKVCSTSLPELDKWAVDHVGATIRRCGTCQPPAASGTSGVATAAASRPSSRRNAAPATSTPDFRYEFEGPNAGLRAVNLWTDRYLPYERLSLEQLAAREELRRRLRSLVAARGEILHASYKGFKPTNMDVENVLLYNIHDSGSSFLPSVANGVRFELAVGPRRRAPSKREYACSYQYRVIPPTIEAASWRRAHRVVAFHDVSLGGFGSAKRLEQSWLAVHGGEAKTISGKVSPTTPFGVFLKLAVPLGATGDLRPELVKSMVDGTIAAFQAHSDRSTVVEISTRLARTTGAEADRFAELLLDQRRAVLGVVNRLVHVRGSGVQWAPSDHMCVVGEVLREDSTGPDWGLSGEIWALESRKSD